MLEGICRNTQEILEAVRESALQSKDTSSEHEKNSDRSEFAKSIREAKQLQWLGDREEYNSIAKKWRRYFQILNVLEESLADNIEKMDEWQRREQDRQDQQPRWTERDKRNHFTTILRLKIFTERQSREIKRLRDKVRSFRESLPDQLGSIREDISFRGSQSINLFTYVTVIFLPLGFATGVLSMNGLPDRSTSTNLVFTALAAFALTLFMLLIAEFVKGMAAPIAEVYRSLVRFLCSLLHLRQVWQSIKYTLFHNVVKPIITCRAQNRRLQKEKQSALEQEILQKSKVIANFSFREAVENEKEKQEESPIKANDKASTSQHGTTSQASNREGITSLGNRRDFDVEKGHGRAAKP